MNDTLTNTLSTPFLQILMENPPAPSTAKAKKNDEEPAGRQNALRSASAPIGDETISSLSDSNSEEKNTIVETPSSLRSHSAPVEDKEVKKGSSLRQPSRAARVINSLRQATITGLRQATHGSSDRTSITHTETALCPICYCNEPLSEMYTVSERCGHRFCKECLAGWIRTLVVEGNVNALACPFDAAMISQEEKDEMSQWKCGTCTMKNPKLNKQCCACGIPKDSWQCKSCTVFNPRPTTSALLSPDHVSIDILQTGANARRITTLPVATKNEEIKIDDTSTQLTSIPVMCSVCHTADKVLPPPEHPAIEGKCGVMMQIQDVQNLCDEDVVKKFERFSAMLSDPNNRDCPNPAGCDHRQIGNPSSPQMVCKKCQYVYCFEHSNAHPNQDCKWYEKKIRSEVQKTKAAVKALGTRPCPYCRVDTLKNSGCNHMTCGQCHNEWCWLCNKGINGNVEWHFDPRNLAGCGGMQMSTNATTGLPAAIIRRFMHIPNFLIGGIFLFVVGLLSGIITGSLACVLIIPIYLCAMTFCRNSCSCIENLGDTLQKVLLLFGGLLGFGPALLLFLFGLSLAIVIWAGLLPLFIGLSIYEYCQGRPRAAILKMFFLPFVLHWEEWTIFFH
jgi:hypothetical protein